MQGAVTKEHLERIIATIQKLEEENDNDASNGFKKEAKKNPQIIRGRTLSGKHTKAMLKMFRESERKNDNKPAS